MDYKNKSNHDDIAGKQYPPLPSSRNLCKFSRCFQLSKVTATVSMKNIRFDGNGIPILTRTDIEEWAEKFILYFDKEALSVPQMAPIFTVCEQLKQKHDVKFEFNVDLGHSPEGYKYRGRFHIPSKTIYIDKSLEWNDPRFNFTLAHELAHFVMHRRVNASVLAGDKDDEIVDTGRQLILNHVRSENPRDWLEWQANKFASSLLLPRHTVPNVVMSKQLELGVKINLGKIYLDNQRSNIALYKQIMDELVTVYQTSSTSVKLRLLELNILIETDAGRTPQSKQAESATNVMLNIFKQMERDWSR